MDDEGSLAYLNDDELDEEDFENDREADVCDLHDVYNLPGRSLNTKLWPPWHMLSFLNNENGYPANERGTRYPRTHLDPEYLDAPHLLYAQHRGEVPLRRDIVYDLDVDRDIVGDDWEAIQSVYIPSTHEEPLYDDDEFFQCEWDQYFRSGTGNC